MNAIALQKIIFNALSHQFSQTNLVKSTRTMFLQETSQSRRVSLSNSKLIESRSLRQMKKKHRGNWKQKRQTRYILLQTE